MWYFSINKPLKGGEVDLLLYLHEFTKKNALLLNFIGLLFETFFTCRKYTKTTHDVKKI